LNKILEVTSKGMTAVPFMSTGGLLFKETCLSESLRHDLDRVNTAGISVDIVFKQGKEVLGL
jgi:hypothetical protein